MQKAAAQRSRHVSPGDKLGKYEVIRQIAVGGMAEIYLARTQGIEGFEKLVVIKRILPQYVANASFVDMFLNEARIAATLHHPNVAQVYDIGVEDGDYFFSMEYVHGEDLDHMSLASEEQGVPLSLDAALTLVAGLCAGLHYAHDKAGTDGRPQQIVHRDVSPSNVLVSYDGAVKLVDFGIARAASRPGTTQGGLKGKIAYMSPEQCRAKGQLDRRSDIYAVGTILYQLTTGRMPFEGETEYQILNQIVNEDAAAPSTIVDGYPHALEQIVLRALARDPANRFATARDMQAAIEDFAHESRLRVSPLVLARLMGTLFPARLEEWDQAKSQGAFFVEQQVVRTLIESGRTPEQGDPTSRGFRAAGVGDDEPTIKATREQMQELSETATNVSPISTIESSHIGDVPAAPPRRGPAVQQIPSTPRPSSSAPRSSMPTPPHAPPTVRLQAAPQRIPSTPMPAPPTVRLQPAPQPLPAPPPPDLARTQPIQPSPQPIPSTPSPQMYPVFPGGTLVSSSGGGPALGVVESHVTPQYEVTERVRVPASIAGESRGRSAWLVAAGLLVVGGGVAAFLAARGGASDPAVTPGDKAPARAEAPAAPEPAAETPAPAVAAPAPAVAEPAKAAEPVAVPAPPEIASAPPAETPASPTKPVAPKRPKPKAKAETKPADPGWNADSPFMPVRTEKKQ